MTAAENKVPVEVLYGLANRERVQCYVVGSIAETGSLVLAIPALWQQETLVLWQQIKWSLQALEFMVDGVSVRMVEVALPAPGFGAGDPETGTTS